MQNAKIGALSQIDGKTDKLVLRAPIHLRRLLRLNEGGGGVGRFTPAKHDSMTRRRGTKGFGGVLTSQTVAVRWVRRLACGCVARWEVNGNGGTIALANKV